MHKTPTLMLGATRRGSARSFCTLGAAVAMALAAGSAHAQQTERWLTINKHDQIGTPTWAINAAVDAMFADASQILYDQHWSDVSCAQFFHRNGDVGSFGNSCGLPSGDYLSIHSSDELNAVLNCVPGYVKIVQAVDYCEGQFNTVYAGCANTNSMVIEESSVNEAWNPTGIGGATWRGWIMAHEFGHTVGLGHTGSLDRVMYNDFGVSGAEGNQVRVLNWECSAYQMNNLASNGGPAGATGTANPPPPSNETEEASPRSRRPRARRPSSSKVPIEMLAIHGFLDSVPDDLEEQYDERDVEALRRMLQDSKFAAHWEKVAGLIGHLSDGSEQDAQALIAFASAPGRRPKDVVGAGFGLGLLANRVENASALAYLAQMSESGDAHRLKGAVVGLAMSGKPQALPQLRRITTLQNGPLAVDKNVLSSSFVSELTEHHAILAERGVRGYYSHGRHR